MIKPLIVRIPAKKAHNYQILIKENLLNKWQEWLPQCYTGKQIVIVTDKIVNAIYSRSFANQLKNAGYKVLLLTINHGEAYKSNISKEYLELEMLKHKYDRHSLCIAFGGGVVGDLTGFVAATYMRGIKYIQIPTTLLAMVDSSVGGKTAINTVHGKNLIGSFWQPELVVMDTSTLNSLSNEQLINGLVEAIKMFLTNDKLSFQYIKRNLDKILARDQATLQNVINRAVKIKAKVVQNDEKEENLRMVLNFGHTVGHALEKVTNYKILHGYAVALGILVESKMAVLAGYLAKAEYKDIVEIIKDLGITVNSLKKINNKELINAMLSDKKNKNNTIYSVLLAEIGKIHMDNDKVATSVSEKLINSAFKKIINKE